MSKHKPYKSYNSNSKNSDNITVRSMRPFYSEEVDRWRHSKGNAPDLDAFNEAIDFLNRAENRISQTKSDGYDYRWKACHKHFGKKLAIFYEYSNFRLRLLRVMKHHNNGNLWKPQ
jgi:hypothetical protein